MLSSILWGWIAQYTKATRNFPSSQNNYLQIWNNMDVIPWCKETISSNQKQTFTSNCVVWIWCILFSWCLYHFFLLNVRIKFKSYYQVKRRWKNSVWGLKEESTKYNTLGKKKLTGKTKNYSFFKKPVEKSRMDQSCLLIFKWKM